MTKPVKNPKQLKAYDKPKVHPYGSVRNLTGGSATMMMDGAIMMALV